MEAKKYIAIFHKYQKSFWITVGVCVLVGVSWQYTQREAVVANLTLNVTRLGSERTTDYQYHDFYRLQADERFADTVVRWLGSPRIISDIFEQVQTQMTQRGSRPLAQVFEAQRLSSQMIQVTYNAENVSAAQAIAHALLTRINAETSALNKDQQEAAWFVIVGDAPVMSDARVSMALVLALTLSLGVFLGFWMVLFRHYFSK